MNTSDTIKLPEGRFDSLGWLAFSGACAGNVLLEKLREAMALAASWEKRCSEAAARYASEMERHADTRDELASMKSAAARNAERILKRKKKK
ncbi:MAG: hypothetical protein IT366_24575 [Candidatus Hydrogenedentes bacterium]|nr:hypothetical protein [Candidatus Hydrogenedentota bacterium]